MNFLRTPDRSAADAVVFKDLRDAADQRRFAEIETTMGGELIDVAEPDTFNDRFRNRSTYFPTTLSPAITPVMVILNLLFLPENDPVAGI